MINYVSYGELPSEMVGFMDELESPQWPPEFSGAGDPLITPGQQSVSYTIDWTMGERTVDPEEFADAFTADWQDYTRRVDALHEQVKRVRDVLERSGLDNHLTRPHEYWGYDLGAQEVSWAVEAPAFSENEARELTPEAYQTPRQLGYDDGDPSDMALYEHQMDGVSYVNDTVGTVVRVVESDHGLVRVGQEQPMAPDKAVAHLNSQTELDTFRITETSKSHTVSPTQRAGVNYRAYGELSTDAIRTLESLATPEWPSELADRVRPARIVTNGTSVTYTVDDTMAPHVVDTDEFAKAFTADWQEYTRRVEDLHGLVKRVRDVAHDAELSGDGWWFYDAEAVEVHGSFEAGTQAPGTAATVVLISASEKNKDMVQIDGGEALSLSDAKARLRVADRSPTTKRTEPDTGVPTVGGQTIPSPGTAPRVGGHRPTAPEADRPDLPF